MLGCGITYAHAKKDGNVSVILCPSHLTNKWSREVERLVPYGKAYIIKSIKDIIDLDSKIRDKSKTENMYLIISKESAKFGYEMRPSAIWSESKRAFVCPTCGQILKKKVFVGSGRYRHSEEIPMDERDFIKPYAYNEICENKVRVWNKNTNAYDEVECHTKLWTPLNGEDKINWIKLGSEGWILERHMDKLFDQLSNQPGLTRKDASFLARLAEKKIEKDNGELKASTRAPRKYPIAKYIKKYYKGYIDYLLLDELHQYKSESLQGQAAGDIANASKKIIGLTGTLLNGYASGLFYILYRTLPALMKREGFDFKDEAEFMRNFGVMRNTSSFAMVNGRQGDRINGKEKALPGVSPLVFTKFLLENAAFLSLSDMAEGLPSYTETPISVSMDEELRNTYIRLEDNLRRQSGWNSSGGIKILGQMLQTLSVYPDMPYDQPPIIHPDTGETLIVPEELARGLRNKENRLLEIVQEKIANGEKVLVYYQWTNRTDLASKLSEMFNENDIRCAVLQNIAADKREEWINNKVQEGIDVLICNPQLVETGLDLLDFTTIIFYQVGYNIYTMRQASRRSWRLSQTHPIEVMFMYYEGTIQEQALSLMATKLQASMAIEGKFSEEGLRAMSNNEDLLTQIANSVVNGIKHKIAADVFKKAKNEEEDFFDNIIGVDEDVTIRRSREVFMEEVYKLSEAIKEYVPREVLILSFMNLKGKGVNKGTKSVLSRLFNKHETVANLL